MLYYLQHSNGFNRIGRSGKMTVRLNITIDDSLYKRLKQETPPKKISAFIEDAVRAKLRPSKADLDTAYKKASRELWRKQLAADWRHVG